MEEHATTRNSSRSSGQYSLYALVGIALAFAFQSVSLELAHGGQPFRMIRVAGADGTGRGEGFDGQFFLALARDPLVRPVTAKLLDAPLIRARRIGFPLAAFVISPLVGGAARALLLVVSASIALIVCVVTMAAWRGGFHPSLCLLVPLVLPLALSAELVTCETLAAALLLGALVAMEQRRDGVGVALLAAACLTKEVVLLGVLAVVLVRVGNRKYARGAFTAAAALPLAAWHAFLVGRLPGNPGFRGLLANLALPGLGLAGQLGASGQQLLVGPNRVKVAGVALAVLWVLVAVVLAIWFVSRRLTPATAVSCAGALLALALSRGAPAYAYDEIFNFGRQLFLLPVGLIGTLFLEGGRILRSERSALILWLGAGSALGAIWWGHKIWQLSATLK